jgi:hypothetical protein
MAKIGASGLTKEEAFLWAVAYDQEASRTDVDNVSAGPRAQLLWCITKMLQLADPTIPATECCREEMAWRHPPQATRMQS